MSTCLPKELLEKLDKPTKIDSRYKIAYITPESYELLMAWLKLSSSCECDRTNPKYSECDKEIGDHKSEKFKNIVLAGFCDRHWDMIQDYLDIEHVQDNGLNTTGLLVKNYASQNT